MMKYIGFLHDQPENFKAPKGFVAYDGLWSNSKPITVKNKIACLHLLGRIFQIKGNNGFRSFQESDLAGILENFIEHGTKTFENLDGEFTIVAFKEDKTVVFRDFKGTGPQVFYSDQAFSNSLSLMVQLLDSKPEPDHTALSLFLKYGFTPPDSSGIKKIKRIAPGCLLLEENGSIIIEKYFNQKPSKILSQNEISLEEATETYFNLHKQGIESRIIAKSNPALLLSGGYDSGGNLAGLRAIYDKPVTAYTIGFKDNPHSELEYVKLLADHFKVDLKNYEIEGHEIDGLPELVEHVGVPFQESGLMINYLVMKMAAEDNPDIILGGDGNDQMFGTAGKELAMKILFNYTGISLALKTLYGFTGRREDKEIFKKVNFYIRKISNILKPDCWGFLYNQLNFSFNEKELITTDCAWTTSFGKMYENRRQNIDIPFNAFNVIMFKASRMAELFEMPLSFPYLSKPVFDFVNQLPTNYKTRGSYRDQFKGRGKTKYLHRMAYESRLPKSITSRKKQGGFVPLSMFFKNSEKNEQIFRFINNSELIGELLKDKTNTLKQLKHAISDQNGWFWYQQVYFSRLFNLLILAVWEKRIIEDVKKKDLNELLNEN